LLVVQGLTIRLRDERRLLLDDVSFSIESGEIVGLLGESGSGKSLAALALMGLLPSSMLARGKIIIDGILLNPALPAEWEHIRGKKMAMIFQDPTSCLNPVMKVGSQVCEAFSAHGKVGRREAKQLALAILKECGVDGPLTRFSQYPHQLSGGLNQRVMLAIALACGAKLLIADEPTTALDLTFQLQMLEVIEKGVRAAGTGLLLISHDLGVIARMAERVLVMHRGIIVEAGETGEVYMRPQHPYTRLLLSSRLFLDRGCETGSCYRRGR